MHRIRTWARTKAHGPEPLVAEGRRSGGGGVRPVQSSTSAVRTSRDGANTSTGDAPADVDVAAKPELSASEKKRERAQKKVMVRFFLTIKDILFSSPINLLLVFVPVGIAAHFVHLSAGIVFAMNAIAIVPLAGLLSHATESVAKRLGDTIGALMNVTFGNAVELIIFIIALVKNEIRIVQASLLGSILANLLLILGMCFLLGGLRFREQIYNSTVTQMSACLLSLSVTSLLLPTAFHASFSNEDTADERVLQVSRGTSVILLLVYGLYLLFQLNSHAYMYESTPRHIVEREAMPGPAANYFNSSSSSESSSSSSSDTDDSSRSRSTAKRIKRAMKGKRSRKQSVVSNKDDVAKATSPAFPQIVKGIQVNPTDGIPAGTFDGFDGPAVADDEADEVPKMRSRQKKKHKHRKHSPSKAASSERAAQDMASTVPPQDGTEPRRVDFALAPDVEAQTDTRPKPFSLRSIRPQLPKNLSQNVFSKPHDVNPGVPGESSNMPRYGPRRANSLPTVHQSYRSQPGAIPPIVPIVVNSTPKTQTAEDEDEDDEPEISRTTAILLLLGSTGLVALCAEFMVDSINEVVEGNNGISEAFIGLILLPIVGNAAEHVTAVTVAMKNKMDLAIGVALGSSIQIAIFVTPLIVILGWIMNKQMSLFFTLFETVSMFVSAFIVNFLVLDGRSNYLEGALLCSAYVIIAVAAFFYPNERDANSLGGGTNNGTNSSTEAIVIEGAARLLVRGMANLVGL